MYEDLIERLELDRVKAFAEGVIAARSWRAFAKVEKAGAHRYRAYLHRLDERGTPIPDERRLLEIAWEPYHERFALLDEHAVGTRPHARVWTWAAGDVVYTLTQGEIVRLDDGSVGAVAHVALGDPPGILVVDRRYERDGEQLPDRRCIPANIVG